MQKINFEGKEISINYLEMANRINNFSKGAVLGGWLGVVIGAVQMLGTGGEALFESSKLYDASAILILTLFWAYWLKGICFVLAENLPQDEN